MIFCRWLDSNCGPLVSEATTLPTETQPLQIRFLHMIYLSTETIECARLCLFLKEINYRRRQWKVWQMDRDGDWVKVELDNSNWSVTSSGPFWKVPWWQIRAKQTFFTFLTQLGLPITSFADEKGFLTLQISWAMVVAQLVEQSLPNPEVHGSNPVISKLYSEHLLSTV